MPDYMFLLESRLSPEQRAVLERVQELSRTQDVNVYLTGGAVRDLISGQPIRDLDFTIEGNPARMVAELEKGGARVTFDSERLRHYEMIFAGDVDGSISAARDEYYERPGTKQEIRFSSIMEDLRRRDFSINAVAISLNTQSRGLLLDPTNGLADIEKQEVRALSIHAFTNQPIRLMRILRYCARMGFTMESRTQEWFDLAMQRGLQENIQPPDVGNELRSLGREDNPVASLKQWEARGFLAAVHPQLQRRKPDYDSLNKLGKVRANLYGAGLRPRLQLPVIYYVLSRLKWREAASALRSMEFRTSETEGIANLVPEAQKIVKVLKSRKTHAPKDAYFYLASLPAGMLAFIEVETPNAAALSKIRAYVQKWRPMRLALPVAELDALGLPRGAKFDKVLEDLFDLQLRGRARDPESRAKLLRQLAGIKEETKRPEKEKKKRRKGKEGAGEPEGKHPATKAEGGREGVKRAPGEPPAARAAASETPADGHGAAKPSEPDAGARPGTGQPAAGGPEAKSTKHAPHAAPGRAAHAGSKTKPGHAGKARR
jgi:tRNA nucleotidyltransferase (CCA-adding enzyme)